ALYAASYVIIAFNEITRQYPPRSLVSSVGQIVVEPNSPIVVNRRVHLVGDLRANDPAIVRDARDRLVARCAEIAEAHDVEIIAKDFDIRPNLYIPSIGGVSHCEREETLDQDMLTGLDALTGVLEQMLDGALDGVAPAERY